MCIRDSYLLISLCTIIAVIFIAFMVIDVYKRQDKWSLAAQNAYSIERDYHILRYFGWIPRYLELFSEIRKTRKIIGKLSTPAHIYLSSLDEMVSPKCSNICSCLLYTSVL